MTFLKANTLKIAALLLTLLSVALRVVAIPHSNQDLVSFNLIWYETLSKGVAQALATDFANYTPPYTYFLALATLMRGFIAPLTAIKLIPTCFDILGAFLIYKIVALIPAPSPVGSREKNPLSLRERARVRARPLLAAAIYFSAPTVLINSSYWGQADSLYTACLLTCLYLLMTERPFFAMLAFGMAFTFKAQAIFLFPFLAILALRKKIPLLYFGLIPLVYLVAVAPVVLLGRPLLDTLLIYANQSNTFASLTMNAPNLYYLLPREWRGVIVPLGIFITALTLADWVYATAKANMLLPLRHRDAEKKNKKNFASQRLSGEEEFIFLAFVSVALTPFLLPKMHDRYFYPADVLSIALAFYFPALWFVPILYQIISLTAISGFLFNASPTAIALAALLNCVTLAVILREQRLLEEREAANPKITSALAWLATLIVPIVLFGLGLNFLLSPYFLRSVYAIPADDYGMSKSERFHWATQTLDYLTSDKKITYLSALKFENGKPVFNESETALVESAKDITQNALKVWQIALLTLFMLAWLAWAGNWTPTLRRGVARGGWLTVGAGGAFGGAGLIGMTHQLSAAKDTLNVLFPIQALQIAFLFIAILMVGGGIWLAKTNPQDE